MIKLIAAMDPTWLLGANNTIPWRYPTDMKRFKKLTMGGIVIMGKNTALSLPKALTGRTLIAICPDKDEIPVADYIASSFYEAVEKAMLLDRFNVWIAGGAYVYRQALDMPYVTHVDLTIVPRFEFKDVEAKDIVYFPSEKLVNYELMEETPDPDDGRLLHRIYRRKQDDADVHHRAT